MTPGEMATELPDVSYLVPYFIPALLALTGLGLLTIATIWRASCRPLENTPERSETKQMRRVTDNEDCLEVEIDMPAPITGDIQEDVAETLEFLNSLRMMCITLRDWVKRQPDLKMQSSEVTYLYTLEQLDLLEMACALSPTVVQIEDVREQAQLLTKLTERIDSVLCVQNRMEYMQ